MILNLHLYRNEGEWENNQPDYNEGSYSIGIWTAGAAVRLTEKTTFPEKIKSVGGKIYPGFKHHPDKLDIILDVIGVYYHYHMDYRKFYESCKYILTRFELETLDERIQALKIENYAKMAEGLDSLKQRGPGNYIVANEDFKKAIEDHMAQELRKKADEYIIEEMLNETRNSAG